MTVHLQGDVRQLRTLRLSRVRDGRFLIVPLDHSFSDGPLRTASGFADLVTEISRNGGDAIVVHKGRVRHLPAESRLNCAVIVHLSGSTAAGPDPDRKRLVGEVEEVLAMGADAVSVHVNLGADSEPDQLGDFAAVARECQQLGTPLLAMMYARGPGIADPADPHRIRRAVAVAADVGADLIKCNSPSPIEDLGKITAESPVPVLVAGGRRTNDDDDDVVAYARTVLEHGAGGLAVGRRVFDHPDPGRIVADLCGAVHPNSERTNL